MPAQSGNKSVNSPSSRLSELKIELPTPPDSIGGICRVFGHRKLTFPQRNASCSKSKAHPLRAPW